MTPHDGRPGRLTRGDVLVAIGTGLLALAVYCRTLAPGLVATVDTPMFQFIGRVLGVPHNPGYPLYVLLTWGFSHVPIGSLAYRINLFSAIFGAVTVALAFLLARLLDCRRTIAAAAALCLAFGPVFWSQSIIAEVYTLDSAIVAAMLLSLLVWGRTRRPAPFYGAVALLGLGLGNHITILGFAPGMLAYVLVVDRRFLLRARTLAISSAIVGASLLQYAFVLVRSQHPGAYMESRASTLGELVRVMSGAQFRDRLFAFDVRTVLGERLPLVLSRILVPELTVAGCLLAAAGALWLMRRRIPEALLLLAGLGAILGFALNYSVDDLPVFLIPAMLIGWLLAGVGTERLANAAGRRVAPAAGLAVTLLAVVGAGWQWSSNVAASDRSRDTGAAIRFDRLFDALPDRTAIVSEDFLVDRMVAFELLGRDAARGREIVQAPAKADAIDEFQRRGFTVLGFRKGVDQLRREGLKFGYEPLRLTERTLRDLLWRLPQGAVVAIAVPAVRSAAFAEGLGDSLTLVGGPAELRSRGGSAIVFVGARGARGGAIIQGGRQESRAAVGAGDPIGDARAAASASFDVEAGAEAAVIRQGGREQVRTAAGVALACWLPDGRLARVIVLDAADGFQVPIPSGPFSVYPLLGRAEGLRIAATEWVDVHETTDSGSVRINVPAGASVVMYASSQAALAPRVVDGWSGAAVDVTDFHEGEPTPESVDGLDPAGVPPGPSVSRVQITAAPDESASVLLALGGIASSAVARVVSGEAALEAEVLRVDTRDLLRSTDTASRTLLMANDDQALLAGAGWSGADDDTVTAYRWMTETEATILLPLSETAPERIRLQGLREQDGPTSVTLRVNGQDLPPQMLEDGWHAYEWSVPSGAFLPGTNDIRVIVDRLTPPRDDGTARGLAVSDVRLHWAPTN